jgi:arginyl-tRNA synthetase
MLITDIGYTIKRRVSEWLKSRGVDFPDVTLEVPSNPDFGDLSLPIAFKLTKILKKAPLDIAGEIVKVVKSVPYVERVEVAGGGYVNIFLNREKYYNDFVSIVLDKDTDFCRMKIGEGLVRIEYTSVNPNKALHIGHARNVVLGAALYNLLSYVGYDVELLNYIDDTGVQMADLLIGFLYLGFNTRVDERFDKYCGDRVYVEAHRRVEESDELKGKRKDILKLIEEGNNVISSFNRMISERVLRDQLKTCWRLGAVYDKLIWESDIVWSGMHKKGLEVLRRSKILRYYNSGKYAGCLVAKVSSGEDVNPEVDDVLVRSDGTLTYVGKDSIFALWKLGLLDFPLPFQEFARQPDGRVLYTTSWPDGKFMGMEKCDLSINIIGVEQSKQQNIIKKLIEGIYGEDVARKYIHYYYNHVWLSGDTARKYLDIEVDADAVKMSGRRGLYINVDDLLDKIKERISSYIKENDPDVDISTLNVVSERIAVAALKYKLLSIDRDKTVVFDMDEALDINRESGAYILYSFARANSIIRKANKEGVVFKSRVNVDKFNDLDLGLIRYMALSPLVILESAKSLEIKPLTNYMYRLCLLFNEFYEKNPVLRADSEELRNSRLVLVKVFTIVMRLFSRLTGIPLVERM